MERINYKGKSLLPVKYDIVFKALFASDDDLELLASLLSSILEIDIKADAMAVMNTELPPVYENGKLSRVDIRVKTADNKHINVEIQLNNEHDIERRSLFYLSKLYSEQVTSGMAFKDIGPTIAINILDFIYLPHKEYHNKYLLMHEVHNNVLTDTLQIHFIELPKKQGRLNENMKDMWVQFLSANNEEVLDMLANENAVFDKAVKKLVYISADEKLRYEMNMREKAELDYNSAMITSFDRGKERGIQEGIQEGSMQKSHDIAEKLFAMGMEDGRIAEILDLPISKIVEMKKQAAK